MDNFKHFERKLNWDFTENTIPPNITTTVVGTGKVIPKGIEQGGALVLSSPSYGDESSIYFPLIQPSRYDETRVKVLLAKNSTNPDSQHVLRIGLQSEDGNYHLMFNGEIKPSTKNNGVLSYAPIAVGWGVNRPTHFEFVWDKTKGVSFYVDNRLIAKRPVSDSPNPNIQYRLWVYCKNQENPSTVTKEIGITQASYNLAVYTK